MFMFLCILYFTLLLHPLILLCFAQFESSEVYFFSSNFKGINFYDRNVLQTEQNYKQIFAWESELVNYCHKIKSHDYTFCRKGQQRDNK